MDRAEERADRYRRASSQMAEGRRRTWPVLLQAKEGGGRWHGERFGRGSRIRIAGGSTRVEKTLAMLRNGGNEFKRQGRKNTVPALAGFFSKEEKYGKLVRVWYLRPEVDYAED